MRNIGIYIHIPFCRVKCGYCDFYSVPFDETLADAYTGAVCKAVEGYPFPAGTADTVYFGGGTPSLMGAGRLSRMLNAVEKKFGPFKDPEITLEANPGTIKGDELAELVKSGFNRISIGFQAKSKRELDVLGRESDPEQAVRLTHSARAAGFRHVSVDVIMGIPGQTKQELYNTLYEAANMNTDHISAYILKIEPNTPIYNSDTAFMDDDEQAGLYQAAVSYLEGEGFKQYEISNFAREGGQCRHNLKYWNCEDYFGIGPSAHSFVNGTRCHFERDIEGFLLNDAYSLLKNDGNGGDFFEYAMLRLRLNEGISLDDAERIYKIDTKPIVQRAKDLEKHGLLTIKKSRIALTVNGFLLSNRVIAYLMPD